VAGETTLEAVARENGCDMGPAGGPMAGQGQWPEWRSTPMAGGDVPPSRVVSDPYPTLHSVAVDSEHNRVVMSDPNRHGLWVYDRLAHSNGDEAVTPRAGIRGPATGMMFVAGVTLDPGRREIYSVDNDIGDRMMVFDYEDNGNVKPKRVLHVPHQSWGISINHKRDELAITVEEPRMIAIYRREARAYERPKRVIRGSKTGLGDPRGVFFDPQHDELIVANHGNQGGRPAPDGATVGVGRSREDSPPSGGRFEAPSLTVYPGDANGNVEPTRRIQGPTTRLNWPMALDLDLTHDEIAVANNGDSSVLVFRRTDTGDVAPVRAIKGARTGITGPMGVALDLKNDELWVSNYGDHTALVFARTANGDVAPKRVLRNAPAGSATVGFGNPGAVAFDTKRDEILVPN
jgi:DNA-binding beta-propeller fold protein YncE